MKANSISKCASLFLLAMYGSLKLLSRALFSDPGTPTVYDPQTAILNEAVCEEPEPISLDYVLKLPHSSPIDYSWGGGLS